MRRLLLVLLVACDEGERKPPNECEALQLSKQEYGECVVEADPMYVDGCPFVLGGYCYPSGRPEDCAAGFPELDGTACNFDGTNCHWDFPQCEPVDATHVKYGVHLVRDGVRGVVRLTQHHDTDSCTFVPCL